MLEQVLSALSYDPEVVRSRGSQPRGERPLDTELDRLRLAFPGLEELVQDRRVLDFGCGIGRQALALAQAGARSVMGVDLNLGYLRRGRALAQKHGLDDRVELVQEMPPEQRGTFDLVISQNAMEHFTQPLSVLEIMYESLRSKGHAAITFSPPWLHPYGAHASYFTPVPWVHLLFPEETVLRVRARYRDDGARRYEEVEGGLNKMTLKRFEQLVRTSRFELEECRYVAIKGLPFVSGIPLLREFVTSRVDCLLVKAPEVA